MNSDLEAKAPRSALWIDERGNEVLYITAFCLPDWCGISEIQLGDEAPVRAEVKRPSDQRDKPSVPRKYFFFISLLLRP